MTDSHLTRPPSSLISRSRLTEAEIDRALAAATAGHRMAGMEPTAADSKLAVGNCAEKSPGTKL